MGPTDEPFGPAPGEENEPDHAMSPPASATWAIETLVPFEGWWQALRLTPAVIYGGLAYASLAKGCGGNGGAPPDDEAA